MPTIRNGEVTEATLLHLGPEDPIPDGADVSLPLARFRDNPDVVRRPGITAVRLRGDDDVRTLAPFVDRLTHVVVEFPSFRDGRCYSHARILREQLGFRGELRATGDVLRDQLFFMARCGVDTFELRGDRDIRDALDAFRDFTVTYQPAADEPRPLWRRRPDAGAC